MTNYPEGTDFVLDVRAVDDQGTPTDTVLASAQVNDVPSINFGETRTITANFAPGAPVEKDHQYALSVTGGFDSLISSPTV